MLISPFRLTKPARLCVVGILLLMVLFSSSLVPWSNHHSWLRFVTSSLAFVDVAWHKTTREVMDLWHGYVDLRGVEAENRRLAAEVVKLKEELVDHEQLVSEVVRLKSLLDLARLSRDFVASEIISRGRSGGFEYIRIAKGKDHGFAVGMAVLSPKGIVGHLERVGERYSDIQLITHVGVSVDVILERTRLRGVIRGTGSKTLRWDPQKREDIKIGDSLMTSGMVGAMPRGFPVARVVKILYGTDRAAQEVWLLPYQDMDVLDYVFVFRHTSPLVQAFHENQRERESF